MAHGGAVEARVLDDRDLVGELGEEAHGAGDDVVEVDGLGEEAVDGAALGGGEGLILPRRSTKRR
nr:hypothetical protein GCM10025732_57010 [Glycomyces mayteni]